MANDIVVLNSNGLRCRNASKDHRLHGKTYNVLKGGGPRAHVGRPSRIEPEADRAPHECALALAVSRSRGVYNPIHVIAEVNQTLRRKTISFQLDPPTLDGTRC